MTETGRLAVDVPQPGFADYLGLAVDEIAHGERSRTAPAPVASCSTTFTTRTTRTPAALTRSLEGFGQDWSRMHGAFTRRLGRRPALNRSGAGHEARGWSLTAVAKRRAHPSRSISDCRVPAVRAPTPLLAAEGFHSSNCGECSNQPHHAKPLTAAASHPRPRSRAYRCPSRRC